MGKRSIDTYDADGDITQDASNDYFHWDDLSEATYLRFGGTAYYEYCSYLAGGLRGYAQQYYQNYSGTQTYFVYDGDILLGEVANQYGNSNVVTAAYTWGPAGPVSEREVYNGSSFWYHYGPQGETRQLTNSSGAVADTYTYTAYGANVATTGSDINPLRYGGEWGYYTDPQVVGTSQSILLCGHRWYDGNTGRFVSRDPLGYGAGENLYAYCENDPVGKEDPDGLDPYHLFFGPSGGYGWLRVWHDGKLVGVFKAANVTQKPNDDRDAFGRAPAPPGRYDLDSGPRRNWKLSDGRPGIHVDATGTNRKGIFLHSMHHRNQHFAWSPTQGCIRLRQNDLDWLHQQVQEYGGWIQIQPNRWSHAPVWKSKYPERNGIH